MRATLTACGLLSALCLASAALAAPPPPFSGVALWQAGGAAPAQVFAQGRMDPLDPASAPLSADAPMPIASITKLLTAVRVMQRVATGAWTLDTTVGAVWPELDDAQVKTLTLKQLLEHSSGLPNLDAAEPEVDGMAGYYAARPVPPARLQDEVRRLARGPLASTPGEKFSYNNLDYLLLGALLERAGGQPYAAQVEAGITAPLHMDATRMAEDDPAVSAYARCALVDKDRLTAPPRVYLQNFGPAGGAVSTVHDLSRLGAALLDGTLLPQAQREALFTPNPALGYVALSVWAYDFAGSRGTVHAIERQGDIAGWKGALILLPQRHAWLVLLANIDGPDLTTWNPASHSHRLLDALLSGATLSTAMRKAGLAAPARRAPAPNLRKPARSENG